MSDLPNMRRKFEEPVPFFSLKKSIRSWMLHPILSQQIVVTSNTKSLPHVLNPKNPDLSHLFNKIHASTCEGLEWFQSFERTRHLWQFKAQKLRMEKKDIAFVHILLFGDGFPLWKLKQQGFEVIKSNNSPAIQLNLVASKHIMNTLLSRAMMME